MPTANQPTAAAEVPHERTVSAVEVKARALSGLKALTARTALTQILRLVSSVTLAHLLLPHDYGVFGVVAYLTGLGMYLGDVGLSAALVRQHAEPTDDETCTVFWSQQILTGVVVAILLASAPWLVRVYHLSFNCSLLLSVMASGLFLSSLRIVPMMMLERSLRFAVVARCELIESITLAAVTILFAFLRFGPWALAGGALVRSFVGLCCVWAASPWRPRGRFRWAIVKRLAGFGAAFQLNAVIPSVVNGWVPLVVGGILGTAALGFMNWSANLASAPLMLSAVLNRIAFPAYSRLHADSGALAQSLIASIRRLSAILWLVVPMVVIVCPIAIPLVFGHRWSAAIHVVQWCSVECIFLTITGVLASAQNACGRAGQRLGVTLAIGAMRWAVGYAVTVHLRRIEWIAASMCLISFIELAVTSALISRYYAEFRVVRLAVFRPIIMASGMLLASLGIGYAAAQHWTVSGGLFLEMSISLLVFVCLLIVRERIVDRNTVTNELRAALRMLRPRQAETGG